SDYQGNPLLERSSLIAIKVKPPKQFKVHDLITIIVRQQKRYESEAELESRKKFEIESTLDAFIKHLDGGIGAAAFRRGKPNIDYEFKSRLRNEGDNSREDTFITRISGKIVDVKPNGNLVIQASSRIDHEEESAVVTLTGECRSTDVTPDNTVLSTQVAELRITVENTGAVRDAASRGWITKLLDWLKPI
ncbi:MAG: flagellar basal body L-ring protein FlgH, partial [Planctomycetota bacterium]